MPINLNSALQWESANADEQAMLADLQGNILKGHGRDHTVNLFLRFKDPSAKAWVATLAGKVTPAGEQLQAAKAFRAVLTAGKQPAPGKAFLSFYLSAAGYNALGVPKGKQPADTAFQAGMKNRPGLNDPLPAKWQPPFKQELHAMLLLAHDEKDILKALVAKTKASLPAAVVVAGEVAGMAYKNKNRDGIEHFGYVDGRSQPLMLKEDVKREKHEGGTSIWDPEFPLKQALVSDRGAAGSKVSFGSYFVFRQLEQNVKGFKDAEDKLAKKLGDIGERAGALIVGRFEDGTPVVLQEDEGMHTPVPNNFDFRDDPAATKCPFHAHIRKVNPRGESVGSFAASLAEERAHIMARRGITYGMRKVPPSPEGVEFGDDDKPAKDVGLLFMAHMGDIGNQFEFTQASWANNPGFVKGGTGIDPVIGQGAKGGQSCPMTWGNLPEDTKFEKFDFRGFVTLLGGEYFFAPSRTGLQNIGK